jgi:diguanylate cyclase (GGDEF)-like protein
MSAVHDDAILEREEFLTVPRLFSYGPRVLLMAGVVIAALAVGAGLWRIHDGRKSGYESAFTDSAATASAAKEVVEQLLARLNQAAAYLDSIQDTQGQQQQFTAVLQGLASQGVAFSSRGRVLASGSGSLELTSIATEVMQDVRVRALLPGGQVMLPMVRTPTAGALVVPVVQRLVRPGPFEHLVFFLDEKAFSGVVRKAVGREGGWLRIEDAAGHEVMNILMASSRPEAAGKPRDKLLTPDQAMQGTLDYNSQRLLVATAPAAVGEPNVSVGLTEAAALVGAKKRIISTWVIVGFVLPVLGSLGLTSFALRRFSKIEEYLRRLARLDVLTGLPNRRSFHGLLRGAVARSRQKQEDLALLFVDIDNFKYVNDSFGHAIGDALLKHVGRVLTEEVREGDVVCRLGGDEFTVLVAGVSGADAALHLGNRILERLKQFARLEQVNLRTKASIGIALMPENARTEEDLMRFADTAMYWAKTGGKDKCVVFDQSMAAQAVAKAQTIQQLESGILAGELFLVYQPKFELSSGNLVGHEALVRWNHPTRGVVYPGDFIALAEESGLILEVGNWVLERALRQMQDWHRQGHGWHRVAVNVSALQLSREDFVARVAEALVRYDVPGTYLQLEITESNLVVEVDRVKRMVHSLRALGLLVAVDDFGTGYSSLAALQQFELDILKVDRSFVSLVHTKQGEAVCRAIITLGHALGMTIIGEGVETLEQATTLARLGCDQVQGFYFAKPLAADLACKTVAVERMPPTAGAPPKVIHGAAPSAAPMPAVRIHHSRKTRSSSSWAGL